LARLSKGAHDVLTRQNRPVEHEEDRSRQGVEPSFCCALNDGLTLFVERIVQRTEASLAAGS
jgi:hypothetical protein